MEHFYFPSAGMVSLVAMLEDGGSIEVAAVGREGVVGAALANGTGMAPMTAIVQVAGSGSRIKSAKFHEAARASASFRGVIAHHNEALLAQVIRTVACNAEHTLRFSPLPVVAYGPRSRGRQRDSS